MRLTHTALAVTLAAAAPGCTKTASDGKDQTAQPETKPVTEAAQPKPTKAPAAAMGHKHKVEVELLPEPRERRLHPSEASASSFLWNDWNKFQENYHPLYLVDDDPRTAWVEGADSSGEGEWIQLDTTRAHATTKVRLRLLNGYHKSKRLFGLNARAKQIDVTLLPSKTKRRFDLADSMDWVELELEQPEGALEAIRIDIVSTYAGTKWKDLCLSDLEIYATSRTPENPEFEKTKLAAVKAWKQERIDAAKYYASSRAKNSPLMGGYLVAVGESAGDLFESGNRIAAIEAAQEDPKFDKALLDRAARPMKANFPDWVQVDVKPQYKDRVPAVDGLLLPTYDQWTEGMEYPSKSFPIPLTDQLAFFRSTELAISPAKKLQPVAETASEDDPKCKRGHNYFFVPPDQAKRAGPVRELLIVACGQAPQREGMYHWDWQQLLHYDDKGLLVGLYDRKSVTTLTWSASPAPKVNGGYRLAETDVGVADGTLTPRGTPSP